MHGMKAYMSEHQQAWEAVAMRQKCAHALLRVGGLVSADSDGRECQQGHPNNHSFGGRYFNTGLLLLLVC